MSNYAKKTFFLATQGCAKNAVDSAGVREALLSRGWEECLSASEADLIIVNTCAFITSAKEESIETVLELAAERKAGAHLVMAGCFVQRNAEELCKALPEVDGFFGINFAEALAADPLKKGLAPITAPTEKTPYHPALGAEIFEPGAAWLKLADGCDNRCSYCAIPIIRGPFRARRFTAIVREAQALAARGIVELNLIAQDSSRYIDPENPGYTLPHLLDDLEKIEGIEWIRVLYMHPANTHEGIVTRMLAGGKVLPYFDLPVQSLIDPTLQRMRRRTTYADIAALVENIRAQNPDAVIRTTLITGYPGETKRDHSETLKRMQELSFDKLGCFPFSGEEGTDAAIEGRQVPSKTAGQRYDEIMIAQQEISAERLKRWVHRSLPVLVCGSMTKNHTECFYGRSYQDAPDVDGLVTFTRTAKQPLPPAGRLARVHITGSEAYDLRGELE
jgi:ribosomal protein S12 methylthiotransferase